VSFATLDMEQDAQGRRLPRRLTGRGSEIYH